jgi:hypothetical protein
MRRCVRCEEGVNRRPGEGLRGRSEHGAAVRFYGVDLADSSASARPAVQALYAYIARGSADTRSEPGQAFEDSTWTITPDVPASSRRHLRLRPWPRHICDR